MILGGALQRAGFSGVGPKFTIKGGVALELRLRSLARATKDLDVMLAAPGGELVTELETALELPYEGFTFRRKGEPEYMPNGAVRVEVALQYSGKPWGTVQVDVARHEADKTEIEMVEAIPLEPFGLRGPETLPCLSLPYHVAEKIHAMTQPPPEGRRNERFRDLVDLLLLREWITDYEAVRRACEEVFAYRATHPWPPLVEAPEHWAGPFERMASELNLPTTDLYQAVVEIRHFLHLFDDSAPLFAEVQLQGKVNATTWYFAVGPDLKIHRVPARVGEALVLHEEDDSQVIPPEWQHEPGGVIVFGVVLLLQERKPIFVERARSETRALDDATAGKPVSITPEIWRLLAEEIIRQTKAPRRAVRALAVFLSHVEGSLPCELGWYIGVRSRSVAHVYARKNETPCGICGQGSLYGGCRSGNARCDSCRHQFHLLTHASPAHHRRCRRRLELHRGAGGRAHGARSPWAGPP